MFYGTKSTGTEQHCCAGSVETREMLSLAMFKGTMIISVAIVHLYASSCDAFFAHPGPWCTQNTCRSTKSPQPQMQATNVQAPTSNASVDIVLSSGHCAFAAHCGFLEGVERSLTRGRVGAVLGTSSGALVGICRHHVVQIRYRWFVLSP